MNIFRIINTYKRKAAGSFSVLFLVSHFSPLLAVTEGSNLQEAMDQLFAEEVALPQASQTPGPIPTPIPAPIPTHAPRADPIVPTVKQQETRDSTELRCIPASAFQAPLDKEKPAAVDPDTDAIFATLVEQAFVKKKVKPVEKKKLNSSIKQARTPHKKATKRSVAPSKTQLATGGPTDARKDGSIGSYSENSPRVLRSDDTDDGNVKGTSNQMLLEGKFQRVGPEPEDGTTRTVVEYFYLSRGAWLIDALARPFDRIALAVRRQPTADLIAGLIEVSRSFIFLSSLIATDDGSEKAKIAIAEAVNSHRQTVANMKTIWPSLNQETEDLLQEYIQITFLEKIEDSPVRIPVGSKNDSRFKVQPRAEEVQQSVSPGNILQNILKK